MLPFWRRVVCRGQGRPCWRDLVRRERRGGNGGVGGVGAIGMRDRCESAVQGAVIGDIEEAYLW